MKSCRTPSGLAAFFLAASLLPATANASTGAFVVPAVFISAAFQPQACNAQLQPAAGDVRLGQDAPLASKSAALLGGRMSSLERLKLQQSGGAPGPSPQFLPASTQPFNAAYTGANCLGGAMTARLAAANPLRGKGDFLASKRLAVSRTSFDPSWNRVQHARLSPAALLPVGSVAASSTTAKLAAVNTWANARIRYVEDRTLYGKADYWASASETLRARAGDCEDIAILKMQLLAAAGVPRSDMYLTLARDLARNADHAMLIVKSDGRYWLLDNATDRLLDAADSHDYRPIMSFGASQKWLHGYAEAERAEAAPPYRSVMASLNARSTGFNR